MKLPVKRTHPKAQLPEFQTEGAACFDLVAVTSEPDGDGRIYRTGLKFEIPDGYHIKVYSRSGHGFKGNDCDPNKITFSLANSVGVIDSDFVGEVMVRLVYDGASKPTMNDWPRIGDRVAQAMLVKNVKTDLIEVEEIEKETARGENGLGSTGQ